MRNSKLVILSGFISSIEIAYTLENRTAVPRLGNVQDITNLASRIICARRLLFARRNVMKV